MSRSRFRINAASASPFPQGDEASDLVHVMLEEIEAGWREKIGPRRYDTMRKVMQEIGVDIFDV